MTSMWKAALLAGAAWSTIAGAASAQQAPAADNSVSVDEVTVTARRREENLKDVPVAVDVVEPMPGSWQILEKSHEFVKKDAGTAVFTLNIPPDGTVELTYRVRVQYR